MQMKHFPTMIYIILPSGWKHTINPEKTEKNLDELEAFNSYKWLKKKRLCHFARLLRIEDNVRSRQILRKLL